METKNDSNGTVTIEDGYATLWYERRVPHPLAAVWKAITDTKGLAAWCNNNKTTIEARTGSRGTTPPRRPISHGSNEKEKVMCTL